MYEYAKLCYIDANSFIIHIKAANIFKDIASDVEKRFDISNNAIKRLLPTGKNKSVIGFMKDELSAKIMAEFIGLRPKTSSYLIDDGSNDKKSKATKNV